MTTPSEHTGPRAVVVTGGGTGIGRATAHAFAARGAGVLVVGRTERSLAETAAGHDTIRTLAGDLTEPDVPRLVVETALREFGALDVLVNNAAVAAYQSMGAIDPAQAEQQIRTNLLAPILLTQCALDPLERSGGTVVNLSTAGALGMRSWPGCGPYGATKAGLDFLTRTWSVELAPRGIRVVGVAPGVVDTGTGVRSGMSEEEYAGFLARMGSSTPAGRVGDPAEIAWWITELTRPEARYATGLVLPVDGALSLT
ncbi:SDR family NAD(P)-dependent oxidoreductase [Streptomyces glomeratus]|uniref:SDR family oxidoreductase n=1 Tax=Streptomyces glomeratus TaxID=284452 RepID=A0ABP6LWL9_9ACTN|nr:SDR family oxidoreductase [Streptomyces glomeratus]MCF1510909.1 SDR family oxidoreductase [Streptomyces glomeratus]